MAIITLTTDLGTKDHYAAVVKAAILGRCPDATIVDISHQIKPFDTAEAAFILRQAYPEFPRGTIHIIGVNPETDGRTPHLVVRHDGHYFIGADNGIFWLLFDGMPHEAFELTMKLETDSLTFPTKTVFPQAACHLAKGGTPEVIGRKVVRVREQQSIAPAVDGEMRIRGAVIHIDTYGNAVTNIKREIFERMARAKRFKITFGRSADDIEQVHGTYGDVPPGDRVAFFGATGYLEIAVNKGVEGSGGGVDRLFGLRVQDPVIVEFMERGRN